MKYKVFVENEDGSAFVEEEIDSTISLINLGLLVSNMLKTLQAYENKE